MLRNNRPGVVPNVELNFINNERLFRHWGTALPKPRIPRHFDAGEEEDAKIIQWE